MKKKQYIIKHVRNSGLIVGIIMLFLVHGCEDFLSPELPNIARTDEIFKDWNDYRIAGLGLYALQQNLVDQLFVLGELRADLLKLTLNATSDLEEVGNYEFNPENEFMSPKGFYRLISASNALAEKIRTYNVGIFEKIDSAGYLTDETEENLYELYGETLCMRAWAYFNMVRIFGKVPYFPEALKTEDEINNYVLSDTAKTFLGIDGVVDSLTFQLESELGDTWSGVNYNTAKIDDESWDYTTWNKWAYYALMGQMYLTVQNYEKAIKYFEKDIFNNAKDLEFLSLKQNLVGTNKDDLKIDYVPANKVYWKNMFLTTQTNEHMMVVWFSKEKQQQNRIQYFLSPLGANLYAMEPTYQAVTNWETQWHNATFVRDINNPENTVMARLGDPGDYIRGHGISYAYLRNGVLLSEEEMEHIYELKREDYFTELKDFMQGVDTVVYKYLMGKNPFDQDPYYTIFRAGSVHLYYAEALNAVGRYGDAESVLNKGITISEEESVGGVRRRVYLSKSDLLSSTDPKQTIEEGVVVQDYYYDHDPFTNEITGYRDLRANQLTKAFLRDSLIIRERALECAWEGERFYDLMRLAERWNDPSYLADKVASKFPAAQREAIHAILMNKENWYIPYFR